MGTSPVLALLLATISRAGPPLDQAGQELGLSLLDRSELHLARRTRLVFGTFGGPPAPAQTVVLRTADRGDTWAESGVVDGAFVEAFRLDADRVWMLTTWTAEGSFPILYRSMDGGRSWTRSDGIEDALRVLGRCCANEAHGLRFHDALKGTVRADDLPLQTEDGGATWSVAATP